MSAFVMVSNVAQGTRISKARKDGNCGWPEAPHIVFNGGWICMHCGLDCRLDVDWPRHAAAQSTINWPPLPPQSEPTFDPTCKCGSTAEDWSLWGDTIVCVVCNCDVDENNAGAVGAFDFAGLAARSLEEALAEDPEWLEVLDTPTVGV